MYTICHLYVLNIIIKIGYLAIVNSLQKNYTADLVFNIVTNIFDDEAKRLDNLDN